MFVIFVIFFLMLPRPPASPRTYTLFPCTTLFRSPPAMGFLGVNTLTAADGLFIPVPARQLDYLSTIHFMQTCREAMDLVSKFDTSIDYGFIRVVCTMFQPSRTNEARILQVMEKT